MYDLRPHLDAEVRPGTNILVSGPPLSGKRSVCLDVLAAGTDGGDGAIVVSTNDDARRILDALGERTSGTRSANAERPVAVIDCKKDAVGNGSRDDQQVAHVGAPADLTGIGIHFSEFLQGFYSNHGVERNRVLIHSLSTLLMYSDLQTVFRFLHVFTGRVQSVDGLGLYTIDSTAHDDQTLNTVRQLFDGIVTTRESGEPSIRLGD